MSNPFCFCKAEMHFLMDDRLKEMFECPACGILLLRSKGGESLEWYLPQKSLFAMRVDQFQKIIDSKLECLRCGHTWLPRSGKLPGVCPKCNSPYWNRPRRRG